MAAWIGALIATTLAASVPLAAWVGRASRSSDPTSDERYARETEQP